LSHSANRENILFDSPYGNLHGFVSPLRPHSPHVYAHFPTGYKPITCGGLGIFLFTTASGTVLGPTQPPSNGYQELFPWG